MGLVVWRGRAGGRGHSTIFCGWLVGFAPAPATFPGQMAPRPLGPLVLAVGGAAAVLGSVLFILWKAYFGRGRERRWDQGEAWWGAEAARLPQWDEWEVSVASGRRLGGLRMPGARSATARAWAVPDTRRVSGARRARPEPAWHLRSGAALGDAG